MLGAALSAFAVAAAVPRASASQLDHVVLEATVRDDLQTIVGTIRAPPDLHFKDMLAELPVPKSDLLLQRTFPLGPERGWVHIDTVEPGVVSFHTILPRRYDACGTVPGVGLFANGLWHPQPLAGAALRSVQWTALVHASWDSTVTLNGNVGRGDAAWSGVETRLALSVIPRADVQTVQVSGGSIQVVAPRPAPRRTERIVSALAEAWPPGTPPKGAVVITPNRRRLARPGPGVLFLSDRAFRLTDGLWAYHLRAVQRGMLSALLPLSDARTRALASASRVERLPRLDPRDTLGWLAWIPEIDDLLYDGRLPFFSEIFDESYPSDPVRDDLDELVDNEPSATAILRQMDAMAGPGTSTRFGDRLLAGQALEQAAAEIGLSVDDIASWRMAPPVVDLSVAPGPEGIMVSRVPAAGPRVPVEVRVDGQTTTLPLGGTAPTEAPIEGRPIVVDPQSLVLDPDRSNNRWPRKWTAVLSAFPTEMTLRDGRISAFADVAIRKQYDTHWLLDAYLATDPENIAQASVALHHYFGALTDLRRRPFRLWLGGGPGLLDPSFRPLPDKSLALDLFGGAAWETRTEDDIPLRGHRLSMGFDTGFLPGADSPWAVLSGRAVGLVPLGGRVALGGRATAGVARGSVEHRLLPLGGTDDVQAIAASAVVGTEKVVGGIELRWQILRYASVPAPAFWLTHLQVSSGADLGVAKTDGGSVAAGGPTFGLSGVGDVLGARPTLLGMWAAWPAWSTDDALLQDRKPQLYLRLSQPF